jgi:hypothetical protein
VASFELSGGDALTGLTGAAWAAAANAYQAGLAKLPAALRSEFERRQAEILDEAYRFVHKHNRSVHARVAGYIELGQRCQFEYPWPVVAVVGICQAWEAVGQNRLRAFWGSALARLGQKSAQLVSDATDDVLRRTNRGIFADSVPTVLYALAAHGEKDSELSRAFLDGPLPPIFDEESRDLMRRIVTGLKISDSAARFRNLADLTLHHFGREQAIFTYQMNARPKPKKATLLSRLGRLQRVSAPVIVDGTLRFRPYKLPADFDVRDHAARVEHFGRAFVTSITASRADYEAAQRYVLERFAPR